MRGRPLALATRPLETLIATAAMSLAAMSVAGKSFAGKSFTSMSFAAMPTAMARVTPLFGGFGHGGRRSRRGLIG
jgi:hypothetical protein